MIQHPAREPQSPGQRFETGPLAAPGQVAAEIDPHPDLPDSNICPPVPQLPLPICTRLSESLMISRSAARGRSTAMPGSRACGAVRRCTTGQERAGR